MLTQILVVSISYGTITTPVSLSKFEQSNLSSICTFLEQRQFAKYQCSHHVSLGYQTRKEWSFVLKCFFNAGISFQILAPIREKALFWISSLEFLTKKSFDKEERVLLE